MDKSVLRSKPIQVALRLILGGIFIYASLDKIAYPPGFIKVVQNLSILPKYAITPVAYSLPWIELLLGIFLIAGISIKMVSLALSSLLIVFIIVIILKPSNITEDCGCFRGLPILSTSNRFIMIVRDLIFLFMAFLLFIYCKSNIRYMSNSKK